MRRTYYNAFQEEIAFKKDDTMQLIEEFLTFMEFEKGSSKNTIKGYAHDLSTLKNYLYANQIAVINSEMKNTFNGPEGFVVAIHVDDKFVFTATSDNEIQVLMKVNMRKRITLKGHEAPVLAISANAKQVYTGDEEGNLMIWSKRTFKPVASLKLENAITSITVNERNLIVGSADHSVYVYMLEDFTLEHILKGHEGAITALRFDEDALFTGDEHGVVMRWSLPEFDHTYTHEELKSAIKNMTLHNKYLYVGTEDGVTGILSRRTLMEFHVFPPQNGSTTSIFVNDDFIYTGHDDFSVRIWQHSTYDLVQTIEGYTGAVLAIWADEEEIRAVTDNHDLFVHSVPSIDWDKIKTRDLRGFLSYLGRTRSNQPSSIHRRVCSLKAYFRFLEKEEIIEKDPAEDLNYPKRPASLPKFLAVEDVKKLLDLETKDLTHHAILEVLYSTGCRVTELCNMNLKDLDLENRQIMIRGGKGSKDRVVLLSSRAAEVLKKYLEERRPELVKHGMEKGYNSEDIEQAVFLSKRGKRISKRTVQHIVSQLSEKVGIQHTTPHMLRHSMASHLTMENLGLRVLQNLLGHASLDTTQIYANVTSQHVKSEFDSKLPIQ